MSNQLISEGGAAADKVTPAAVTVPYGGPINCVVCNFQMYQGMLGDGTLVMRCPRDGRQKWETPPAICPGSAHVYFWPMVTLPLAEVAGPALSAGVTFPGDADAELPDRAASDPPRVARPGEPGVPVVGVSSEAEAAEFRNTPPDVLEQTGVVHPRVVDPLRASLFGAVAAATGGGEQPAQTYALGGTQPQGPQHPAATGAPRPTQPAGERPQPLVCSTCGTFSNTKLATVGQVCGASVGASNEVCDGVMQLVQPRRQPGAQPAAPSAVDRDLE